MPVNLNAYHSINNLLQQEHVQLIAVSKTKPVSDIEELYALGQRDFGENYVQELVDKEARLPKDIHWHFIGHLQSNKVKYIAPFVHLIHGVDSLKLLQEINKQAIKNNRTIGCLLQFHIAEEETKFGLDESEIESIKAALPTLQNIQIEGFMGMASFSDDMNKVKREFIHLKNQFDLFKNWAEQNPMKATNKEISTLSMGMSGDYPLAIECGSTMVRIGSLLFGARNYNN
ncbi:MAG: YggS family pyridoxal phosphate-dependent enzyme [Sphingobacteriia bacterium]|jgi:pyridoxal phosphate enzyme (YggS family)